MQRGRPFKKGENGGAKGGARPGAGQPSDLHRAACRALVEQLKIRDFFGQVTKGDKVDFTVSMGGKVVKIPASIRNRILAGVTLIEHGYGKAPQEITHNINPEAFERFETKLLEIFQTYLGNRKCPGCGTLLKLPAGLAREVMNLSKIFEFEDEAQETAHADSVAHKEISSEPD